MLGYEVIKPINNSAVLVKVGAKEAILLGNGIGYQKKEGDIIEQQDNIDKVYQLVNSEEGTMMFIATVIEIMDASVSNGFSFSAMKSLTDHIAAMYVRILNQERIVNPFHFETKSLYARDYEIGMQVAKKIADITGIQLPDHEIDFLTLYIRYGNSAEEKKTTDLIHSIIYQVTCLLSEKYQINLDKSSIDYSRFVVHLRFVIERVLRNEKNTDLNLKGIFDERFSKFKAICDDIVLILEQELQTTITEDERMYLYLHLSRLRTLEQTSIL